MLNFLPQKNKNQIVFEYLLRVSVFLLVFILVSSVVLISLFVPSFFYAKYNNDAIAEQLKVSEQNISNTGGDPIALIKNVNDLSSILSSLDLVAPISYGEIINKIVSIKNKDIKILSINIAEDDTGTKTISINGTSNTRDSLIAFEDVLVSDGSFNNINFPVSDFIQSSNSQFSATLNI